MRRPLPPPRLVRWLGVFALLGCLVVAVLAVDLLRDDAAVEDRGSVTEGEVTAVRSVFGRDQVVVSLDKLDGRPVTVTQDGRVQVGQRLVVQYDRDGAVEEGKVAGSTRDARDGRTALGAALGVLVAAATRWRGSARRADRPEVDRPASDGPLPRDVLRWGLWLHAGPAGRKQPGHLEGPGTSCGGACGCTLDPQDARGWVGGRGGPGRPAGRAGAPGDC